MRAPSTMLALTMLAALAAPIPAAAVNCAQVNKYLATGRSVQDIAETMIIPEVEVKKCQQEGASTAAGGASAAAPTPGAGGAAKPK